MGAQIPGIPGDATQLVISIGGNDALRHVDLLDAPVTSTADALHDFDERVTAFEVDYRLAVEPVFARGLPVTLCTIYNGAFEDTRLARRARVALMMFNDVILRVAFEHQASAIDLRLVCSETTDYANPIEPSGPGGLKIAKAIVHATGVPRTRDHAAIVCS
jgi:hypothetical protein